MSMVKAQPNRQPAVIQSVTQLLAANMKAIASCLPKHMTPERMCRVAVQMISRTPQLQECSAVSLVAAIVEASTLGLELDMRGQAYLVPFYNKKTGRTEVQMIPGYKGLMDLAYRSGRVANVYAETVCENDEFVFELGLHPKLEHKPNLEDRGKLRAVYAVARIKDADPVFIVMGKGDIEKVKRSSKAADNGPWKDWEQEMWKKTCIRRLCKYLPLSPEMQRAIAIDEAAEAGVSQHLAEAVIDLPMEQETAADTEQLNAALGQSKQGETINMEDTQPVKETVNADTGEVIEEERMIACPKKGDEMIPEEDCHFCREREGCPAH